MRGWGTVPAAVAIAAMLGGCGVIRTELSGGGHGTSCLAMSSGACDEQGELVAARHPGATQVDLTCAVPLCDRRGGAGTAVVTLRDGTRVNDSFAYPGNPVPLPAPQCVGLAPDLCQSLAVQQDDSLRPSQRVVRIEIRCTAPAGCTKAKGETDVKITMNDGSVQEFSTGWEGGLP